MSIYLHHYPASLFSEKVRVLLGYLDLEWHSVEISSIMPRPLLMPLTGGYRKTPTLQIAANVFCDTAVIARGLVRHTGDDTLFEPGFAAHRVAEWADTQLFRVTVALNFRPEAIAELMAQMSSTEVSAFMEDRAKLADGADIATYSPAAAEAYLTHYLSQLDASFAASTDFLFGSAPSIADFSVYHCLWFLDNNPTNTTLLDPWTSVREWMRRMAAFGHGRCTDATAEEALDAARASEPNVPDVHSQPAAGFELGSSVTVTPVDYGRIPVSGKLVAWTPEEIVIDRRDPEAGHVMTHFPSAGFEVAKV